VLSWGRLVTCRPSRSAGKPVDHRSDIFSLGLILYEMLSGKRAFQAQSAAEIMAKIASADTPQLDTPPVLGNLVSRCLEKRAEERFQSARDLSFALSQLLALAEHRLPCHPTLSLERGDCCRRSRPSGRSLLWPWVCSSREPSGVHLRRCLGPASCWVVRNCPNIHDLPRTDIWSRS